MVRRVDSLMKEGLTPEDLTLCWLSRRVRPLQNRAHKMCFMSGRLSMKNYSTDALDSWMWMITKGHVGEDWEFFCLHFKTDDGDPADEDLIRRAAFPPPGG